MTKVVLIGDSVREGYQKYVQAELAAEAEVWAPDENGGTSRNVLNHLDEWVLRREPDIVHVNCGLHDIAREFGSRVRNIPLEEYESNVREVLRRASQGIKGTVIWAATTPVNEAWHRQRKPFDRLESDVQAYNESAARAARVLGIPIDDLFGVIMAAGRDKCLSPDGVHFDEAARALLGKAVADFIRPYLDRP